MTDLTTDRATGGTTTTTTSTVRRRAVSVVAAVAVTAALWLLSTGLLDDPLVVPQAGDRPDREVTLSMVVFVTALMSLLGWAALVVLERYLARGRTVWVWLSLAVTAASMIPLMAEGMTASTRLVLAVLHLAVTAVIVPGMTRGLSRSGTPAA
jgi:hypothetical protein